MQTPNLKESKEEIVLLPPIPDTAITLADEVTRITPVMVKHKKPGGKVIYIVTNPPGSLDKTASTGGARVVSINQRRLRNAAPVLWIWKLVNKMYMESISIWQTLKLLN